MHQKMIPEPEMVRDTRPTHLLNSYRSVVLAIFRPYLNSYAESWKKA